MPATRTSGLVSRIHPALPIFRIVADERTVFYTPGDVRVTTPALAIDVESILRGELPAAMSEARAIAQALVHRGRAAAHAWTDMANRPFEPECLTLYLSNQCSLACTYCFSAPIDPSDSRNRRSASTGAETNLPLLDPLVVAAAARLVARNCASKSKPLSLVVHGGGEPTQHWDLLQRVRAEVEQAAADQGLATWAYIATNGVLAEERAVWLANNFNLIGLSCDGPPEIQNANRATGNGLGTAHLVERTARAFARTGVAFSVRATIVPATSHRQSDIVRYAREELGANLVRFEPAYHAKRGGQPSFRPDDAEEFVDNFLEACAVAREIGCDLRISGVRLDEIHGPYCNPLREVLQLTPDGNASGCFLNTATDGSDEASISLGKFDALTGEFVLDYARATAFRRRAARIPSRCESCVNVFHCARDCPDVCMLTDPVDAPTDGFRCRVQKALGLHWITELAAQQSEAGDLAHVTV